MSPAARIGALVVVTALAFGGAFLLFGGSDDSDEVASGGGQTSTTPTTGTAAEGHGEGGGGHGEGAGGATDDCMFEGATAVEGSPYAVTVQSEPDPPKPQGTTFEVLVQRDGEPLSGATVCIAADMSGMSHAGAAAQAEEVAAGQYEMGLKFGMRGTWSGQVLVIDEGTSVSMPVSFNVQ